ncbi:MAG: T9SS type A sorting domain-containing protein [Flavobacteriales bacterium]|nr:T9SS type A sorting domain-containing protein [Flavobacteriales bacterium]
MKKYFILFLFASVVILAQEQTITPTITPTPFEVGESITITVDGSEINETLWGGAPGMDLYLWGWMQDINGNALPGGPDNGTWVASSASSVMTYNAGTDTYTKTFIPEIYYGDSDFKKMGFLVKALNGTGDKKTNDNIVNVGNFTATLTNPVENSNNLVASGTSVTVTATNTGGLADYSLEKNGVVVDTDTGVTSFSSPQTINENSSYKLSISQGGVTIVKRFSYILISTPVSQAMPSGLDDGVNYSSDYTKATLVLNAPFKDYVYVAGSFNNWAPTSSYLMKKDPTSGKFWLEITGLTANQVYTYQYWVVDNTNRPINSPALVKTADPFSELVLSPFDDPEIRDLGVYPNLPQYPEGQEREVTVLQTGDNTFRTYNWSSATTNFVKPAKKDLIIYEVLVRDFDANRTYQDLIDRFDYFKNSNINAIQLMPIMEFDGNMSWGYNTSFHLAPDKRYGSPAKLKEFIDLCHQNNIAVILDVALNHVFGRSPLVRMWMLDTDGDGWDNGTSAENPYINQVPKHSYNVGSDLNHFREPDNLTNHYVTRTIKHWIHEYKIDGFRWDLTKGFTNNCEGDEVCTNTYQADRVAKLKWYADLQWNEDPTFYVIFEHLGNYNEETQWTDYGQGVMPWRNMNDPYANLLKGNATNISGVTDTTPGRLFIGYAESHDEERVIYKAISEAGQTNGDLYKAHKRMSALGALHNLVPGPKMIWHFSDLGWDKSLWTCQNGTVSYASPDCKLDTKPQPQWTENWLADANRKKIYDDWSRMNGIKIHEDVFENGQWSWNFDTVGRPRLDISTSSSPSSNLEYVFILTNFSNNQVTVPGYFPYTGTWYNLMDNSPVTVGSTTQSVTLEADGGFRVFGNQKTTLSGENINLNEVQENANLFFVLENNPVVEKQSKVIYNANGATNIVFNAYSLDGKLVYSQSVDGNKSMETLNLNLPSGNYILEMSTDVGNKTSKIILK